MTDPLEKDDSDAPLEYTSSRRRLPRIRKITTSAQDEFLAEKDSILNEIGEEIRERKHDINNLITVIIGTTEIAKKHLTQGKLTQEEIEKALANITQIAATISNLIQSPLASFERAKNNVELTPENINVLNICQQIESLFPGTPITITSRTCKTIIEADLTMILRVIFNIIQNAIKFSNNPNTPVMVNLENESDRYLVISITDFGPGIEEASERLFKSGYRSPATAHLEGSGLGLAFCQKAVHYHGGRISAHNNESSLGSTFTVKLPYKQRKAQVTKIR